MLEDKYSNNIKLYKRKNQGVSSSRNFGISVSTGSYIMFVDSDDVLDGMAVERVMDCAKRSRVDIVRFSYVEKYADSKKVIGMGDVSNKVIDCKYDNIKSIPLIPVNSSSFTANLSIIGVVGFSIGTSMTFSKAFPAIKSFPKISITFPMESVLNLHLNSFFNAYTKSPGTIFSFISVNDTITLFG